MTSQTQTISQRIDEAKARWSKAAYLMEFADSEKEIIESGQAVVEFKKACYDVFDALASTRLVYLLVANGIDYLTSGSPRRVENTVVFGSREAAEKRVEKFRAACIEQKKLDPEHDIDVQIRPYEVIEE